MDLFGNEIVEQTPISRDMIVDALSDELRRITADGLAGMLTNRVEAIIDFARLCNGESAGQKISLLFNSHRLATATNKSKSLVKAMQDRGFCSDWQGRWCGKVARSRNCSTNAYNLESTAFNT